jgi:D-inositol-3-phosphate glycosyltransferase
LVPVDTPIRRVAMISVHGCPMACPGMRSAGGMNVYLKQVASLLAQRGICVDVFTRTHQVGGPEIVDLGPRARVVHLPVGPPDLSKEAIFDYLPEFLQRMDAFAAAEGLGYDLLHSHYWFSGWVGTRLASSWGVPHIVTFHTLALVKQSASGIDEPPERRRTELELATGADGIVAFTPDEQEALVEMYGAPYERIQVVPGGVDLDRFRTRDKISARWRLGFDPNRKLVLYVGRLDPFKGPELLLHVLHELSSSDNTHLVVVGGEGEGDSEANRLRLLAAELGITSMVHWQSAIPQDELADYYNAADVLAMPSYHESFGFVALEAMACGTPVVAARVGALRSLVLDGRTGCLVPDHEAATWASCLEDVLGDVELRRQLGQGAQEWARQFPWSRVALQMLDVYGLALAGASDRAIVAPCPG